MMRKLFGNDWKSTLTGIGLGALSAVVDLWTTGGVLTAKTIAAAVVPTVLGRVMNEVQKEG